MVDSLILKTASLLDVEVACTLLTAQFVEHDIRLAPNALRAAVEGLVTDAGRGAVVLATDGETLVGLAVLSTTWTLEHGGLVGWLDELYVLPARRSEGIGAALLERTSALAREQGCLAIELEVDEDHARAIPLYERAGFSRLARTRWSRRLEPLAGSPKGKTPTVAPRSPARVHRSRLVGFIIDCNGPDLDAATHFWEQALGMRDLGREGGIYARLDASKRDLVVEVQRVDHESRVHIDLEADDVDAEADRLEKLGARRIGKVKGWWVLEAPTGQRFCVVPAKTDLTEAAGVNTWDVPGAGERMVRGPSSG